jgi:transcriptional regulator with XRE-family HTH domain
MAKQPEPDVTMAQVRALFEKSGLTLIELGLRMGYPKQTARQSAWQFIAKTDDPRVSVLKRFANGLGIDPKDLITGRPRMAVHFDCDFCETTSLVNTADPKQARLIHGESGAVQSVIIACE